MPRDTSYVPVRNPVTRTGKKFRRKVPSIKEARMIRAESILEGDAIAVLDVLPTVRTIREQPERVTYYDEEGKPHDYYPDFRVETTTNVVVDIEVKPKSKLRKAKTHAKLRAVSQHYERQGKLFRIWTDETIRSEPRFSTVKRVREHAKADRRVPSQCELNLAIGPTGACSFREATERLGGEAKVLHLIAMNSLRIDFEKALTDEALVWLKNFSGGGDATLCI